MQTKDIVKRVMRAKYEINNRKCLVVLIGKNIYEQLNAEGLIQHANTGYPPSAGNASGFCGLPVEVLTDSLHQDACFVANNIRSY